MPLIVNEYGFRGAEEEEGCGFSTRHSETMGGRGGGGRDKRSRHWMTKPKKERVFMHQARYMQERVRTGSESFSPLVRTEGHFTSIQPAVVRLDWS